MRSLTRFGVAVAATALASATALSGAALANAQFGDTGSVAADDFTLRSPSTLVAERTGEGVEVTYTNETDRTLVCFGISAPSNVIRTIDAHVKRYGVNSMTGDAAEALEDKLGDPTDSALEGKLFVLGVDGTVSDGGLGGIDEGYTNFLIAPDKSITWEVPAPTGYAAGALMLCGEPDEEFDGETGMPLTYVEYVSTNTSGGAGSGSLGSAGSGSLGSLGSLGS